MRDEQTIETEATELLRTLIRNACVNDGTPASGHEERNADALEAYFAGSGLAFSDRGAHELKGLEGTRQLLAVN